MIFNAIRKREKVKLHGPTKSKLYIFTSGYPFGRIDQSFVGPQITQLVCQFPSVIIVPYFTEGDPAPLAKNVKIDESLSRLREGRFFSLQGWMRALTDQTVFRELCRHPSCYSQILKYALLVKATEQWANKIKAPAVCYTMSMGAITLGLAAGRESGVPIKVVSRCIGGDVYEDQHASSHIPFKETVVDAADQLFPCSEAMATALKNQFPQCREKFRTSRMGVPRAGFVARASIDGVRRIVSCGSMDSLKRYPLLAQAVGQLAAKHPEVKFEWRHMPTKNHPELRVIAETAGRVDNLKVKVEDASIRVMESYEQNPADLFAHVSRSEGLPFVIMEALSCGLPVIATDAGGVGELVDSQVGKLLPVDISPGELAQQLWKLLVSPSRLESKKSAAVQRWEALVNAETNYKQFASELAVL